MGTAPELPHRWTPEGRFMKRQDQDRTRSCTRKVKYTREEAKRVVAAMRRRNGTSDVGMYGCHFCGFHHVSRRGNSRRKKAS